MVIIIFCPSVIFLPFCESFFRVRSVIYIFYVHLGAVIVVIIIITAVIIFAP